ncbi:MAG: hypothetical protein GF320_06350 [Armatimonadia bacterium]|nr:hypothetical protein [Armatimonadia bacterium]
MRCDEARRWLDGSADEDMAEDVAAHVERCADCAHHYAEGDRLAGLLRSVGPAPMERDLWDGIQGQLRRRRSPWAWLLAPAAGLAAGALLAMLLLPPVTPSDPGALPEPVESAAFPAQAGDDPSALEEDAQVLAWHASAAAGGGLVDPWSAAIAVSALPSGEEDPS